ncbi:T9SS type A sorting domain-containing protein [Wenyingzhuangia aestuarii]|uniref:T9SS type A sorting domain-containing protein n=1 Tax=Wenyingzhuangia aestuarii TaxID=1647582 RepID=UPI00143CB5F3|nr:T9SS type A sorting domain-containing protein [Wenyingzhuangia aestuarii]NJB83779.1 hypothetical protein [Wenyingzhuangia aestuarii]
MKKILIIVFFINTLVYSQTPGGVSVSNMSIWLSGDDNVTNTGDLEWGDKLGAVGGTGYKAFQPSSGNKATQSNLFNFHKTFTFDGSNDYFAIEGGLNYTSGTSLTDVAAFIVYKTTFSSSEYNDNWAFIDFDRSEAYNFYVHGNGRLAISYRDGINDNTRATNYVLDIEANTPSNNNVPHIGTFIIDRSTDNLAKMRLDGFEDKTQNLLGDIEISSNRYGFIGDGSEANSENGTRNNLYYDGDIAEIILIDKGSINYTTEVLRIESYLAMKYGITLDNTGGGTAGDYLYYNGTTTTTVWDASANSTYHHNVAALIKADNYDLDQKIAASVAGDLVVANDEDFTSENSNVSRTSISTSDGDFLFFGNNDESGFEVFEVTDAILKKIWLFKESTDDNDDYYIAIPKNIFPPGASNVRMMISADDTFTTASDVLVTQEGTTTDYYYFKEDIDNNNRVSFIFDGVSGLDKKLAGIDIDRFDIVLRADKDLTNSGSSLTWQDGGLYAVNGFQNSSSRIPNTTSFMNFNPTLTFDGANDYIALQNKNYDAGDLIEDMHGFVVYSTDFNDPAANDLTGNWSFIDFDRSEAYNFYIVPSGELAFSYQSQGTRDLESASLGNDGLPHIAEFIFDADLTNETFMKFDGNVEFNSDLTTSGILVAQDRYGFIGDGSEASSENGSRNNSYYDGQISEVLLADRESFSAAETLQIESYLALKYGITLNSVLGSYKNSQGTVLWDNTAYWNGVAGIVKDNTDSELDQRVAQSTSAQDIILATDLDFVSGNNNHTNRPTTLTEGSSLLFGNEGSGTGYASFTGGASTEYITARKWLFKEVGANTGTVYIGILKSYFPEDATSINYVISSNDTFSLSEETPIAVTSGTGDEADYYYINIDVSDGDRLAFTFTLPSVPSPGAVNSGLAMWIKSDKNVVSSNGIITSISDSGINSHDISQSTNLDKPNIVNDGTFNYNPSVDFDGTRQHFAVNDLNYTTSGEINKLYAWVVYKTESTNSNNGSFLSFDENEYFDLAVSADNLSFKYKTSGGASVTNTGTTDTNDGKIKIAGFIQDETLSNATVIRLNGDEELANNTNDTTIGSGSTTRYGYVGDGSTASSFDGGNTGDYYEGNIAEIIYYQDQTIAPTDISKIETYLAIKYGITIPGDYVNSAGTTIWSATTNASYHNNVFGLIKDEDSELEQKQSKSANDNGILAISIHGSIATNNNDITGTFSDLDYLIIGNDGAGSAISLVDAGDGVGNCLKSNKTINRNWKVNASGSMSGLTLSFDLSALPDPDNYDLVIDDDGVYTSGIIATETSGVVTGSTLTFTGVTLANGNVFTLTTKERTGEIIYGSGVWFGGSGTGGALSTSDTGKTVQILEDVTLPTSALCDCINIGTGTVVTVSDGNYLHLEDEIELDGDLYLEGSAELIQSNASGDVNTGSGSVYKILNEATSSIYRYNYFASPVHTGGVFSIANNLKINEGPTLGDNSNPGFINNDLDGFGTTFSTRWFHTLNNDFDFTEIDQNTSMAPGIGFTMKGTSTANAYNLIGTPNNGDIDVSISAGKFLLTGNPYPSTISANAFNTVNNTVTDGTIYLWDQPVDTGDHFNADTDNSGGYATITNGVTVAAATLEDESTAVSGATTPSLFIKPGQGFIVYSTSGGTVSFSNTMRDGVPYDGSRHFFKTDNTKTLNDIKPLVRLGFEYQTNDNKTYHRQLVTSLEGNTLEKEIGKDAFMFDYYNNDAYWIVENDIDRFIITSVPNVSETLELPIGVVVDSEKEVTFNIDDVENLANDIYLLDKELGNVAKISGNNTYTTTVASGDHQDRFSLVFKEAENLDTEYIDTKSKTVIYIQHKIMNVVLEQGTIQQVELYNLAGQKLMIKNTGLKTNKVTANLHRFADQIYIVKVVTNHSTFTQKITIE